LSTDYVEQLVRKFLKIRMEMFETITIKRPGSGGKQRVNDEKLIDLWEKGMSLIEISKEVGYDISTVIRRFKKYNIKPMRKKYEKRAQSDFRRLG